MVKEPSLVSMLYTGTLFENCATKSHRAWVVFQLFESNVIHFSASVTLVA
ncbi:hypothetical protein [Vibrio gallaecicus]|nr:hypothetical protein [Vibrio gallaecicus]MDN3617359.1 hypothetical protein [Vibrio gallaecicus]